MIYPLKMVIFHSYVSLPEGKTIINHPQKSQEIGAIFNHSQMAGLLLF